MENAIVTRSRNVCRHRVKDADIYVREFNRCKVCRFDAATTFVPSKKTAARKEFAKKKAARKPLSDDRRNVIAYCEPGELLPPLLPPLMPPPLVPLEPPLVPLEPLVPGCSLFLCFFFVVWPEEPEVLAPEDSLPLGAAPLVAPPLLSPLIAPPPDEPPMDEPEEPEEPLLIPAPPD